MSGTDKVESESTGQVAGLEESTNEQTAQLKLGLNGLPKFELKGLFHIFLSRVSSG